MMKKSYLSNIILATSFLVTYSHAVDVFKALDINDKQSLKIWIRSADNLNELNEDGQTALIKAVQKNNKKFVAKLSKSWNVNFNIVDKFGKTALDYAVEKDHKRLFLVLVKKEAKVTTQKNLASLASFFSIQKKLNIISSVACFAFSIVAFPYFSFVFLGLGIVTAVDASNVSKLQNRIRDYLLIA